MVMRGCPPQSTSVRVGLALLAGALFAMPASAGPAQYDLSRYLSPDEIEPGMKGFGLTVMSGTKIEKFEFEVISIMRNAWYADKDVILVRCSGLNLEHSGIIGGMSGSPCYVVDNQGGERMIGAVAYGWSFNKDPVCGVQPITQMVEVARVLKPSPKEKTGKGKPAQANGKRGDEQGAGVNIAEILAPHVNEPIHKASRYSIFNQDIRAYKTAHPDAEKPIGGLQPLRVPLMCSARSAQTLDYFRDAFTNFGFDPVISGGAGDAMKKDANVKLEPGSALCIPFITGDLQMEGLGTCTEVIGDDVLGFGHSMFSEGSVELPLATGMVHTAIASVMRSNKLGAALNIVGTLHGDESAAVYGRVGKAPAMIPLTVSVKNAHGDQSYNYNVIQEKFFTSQAMVMAVLESIYTFSDPPKEHTIRYDVETEFAEYGVFRTSNFTSMGSVFSLLSDVQYPIMSMQNAPFGMAKVAKVQVNVTVENEARAAYFDEIVLPRKAFRPGETITAQVRYFHPHREPRYTDAVYEIDVPDELPDGEYKLTVGGIMTHLRGLMAEKPHVFQVETLDQMLAAFNVMGRFSENQVALRLESPRTGLAVKKHEMPELPSYQRHILTSSERSDVTAFTDAHVKLFDTRFAVAGGQEFTIKIDRRLGQ